jgi:DNA repair exonuclease SbcCD nuclease subunit
MSKSLIFSDVHFHPWAYGSHITDDGLNSRLAAQAKAADEMIEDAVNNGVKHAYFCGDLFHTHGNVPTQALKVAADMFTKIRNQGIAIRAIPGNHDQYDRQGRIHGLQFLPESERIGSWVDEGQRVRSLPYTDDDDVLKRFLEDAGDGEGSMLLLHQGVSGIPLSSGYVLDERLTSDMIPDNCRAFTGHYHFYKPVTPKLTVVGNLTPLGWGDIDQSKGWLIWDRETGSLEQSIQTSSPEFVTYNEGDMTQVVGRFVRYSKAIHYSEQPAVREALIKEGALSVEFPTMKVEKTQDNIRGGEGITVEHIAQEFDKKAEGRRAEIGLELRASTYTTPEWRT